MLAAALIVFREVLEAALIVTIIMAATRLVPRRGWWIALGIAGGVAGAGIVAALTRLIAALFEGAGQEIVNASILFLAVILISWHVVWMNSHGRKMAAEMRAVGHKVSEGEKHMSVLAIVVGLAVMREGSEIVLMLQGLYAGTGSAFLMLGGAGLGLLAGIAVSALMYAGFLALPIQRVFAVTNGILVLIAAGMAARGANFLTQAGLINVLDGRAWDTSAVLPDQSIIGQFLAALVGYIARPSGIEIVFYAATVLAVCTLMFTAHRHARRDAKHRAKRVMALIVLGIGANILFSKSAVASPPPMTMQIDTDSLAQEQDTGGNSGLFGSRSQNMLGDMWGLRPWLSQYGTSFNMQETSEVLGNVSGGIHQGFDYDGLTQMSLQTDTQRAFGWYGGAFNISALQIHGRNLSADNLGTLQTASGIEADRATRLWELWYDQKFLEEDRLDVKIGQQSLDQEFMTSANANLFVNTMFGWPMLPSADLPGGGPAYPLSAPGVRLRARPDDSFTLLTGVFNGSPVANNSGDPQRQNPSGTSFPLNGGVLAITELQYAYPALGAMVSPDQTAPLSGTYKLGVWYDSEDFADQEYDNTGLSLANPSSTGNPLMHHGDYGIYAVADQMLWHSENLDDRTLNFFTRLMGTPQTDRNPVDFSMNAGFTLHEPIPLRDDDTAGIGVGYADISSRAAALDRDMALYNPGTYSPVRGGETYIEATYQYQVMPWWQLQPDFQYVFNPGAGIANPNGTNQRVGNEAVIGLRTNILL